MNKYATSMVIAAAAFAAEQTHAIELLVVVKDTVYRTEVGVGMLANATGQVSSVTVAPSQEAGRRTVLGLLQNALNYEAGARGAAYQCQELAKIIVATDPRDPRYGQVLQEFDAARRLAYQHARTARSLTESANAQAQSCGLGGILLPSLSVVRQAEQAAVELNRLILDDGELQPVML